MQRFSMRGRILIIVVVVIIVWAGLSRMLRGGAPSRTVACEDQAAQQKDLAEELMVEYLFADREADRATKNSLRSQASRIDWPPCAYDAGPAMRAWMDAVDASNQTGMTQMDYRFLRAFD